MPEAMMTTRVNGRDVGSGQGISVTVADGRIAAIEPTDPELTTGPYLAEGLIDLQVNGFGGLDFNDGMLTPARVAALTLMMAGLGVTTYLPTLITASRASLLSAARDHRRGAAAGSALRPDDPFRPCRGTVSGA
jgi:N-acetylglucosamine-6-phosphate deacetylase